MSSPLSSLALLYYPRGHLLRLQVPWLFITRISQKIITSSVSINTLGAPHLAVFTSPKLLYCHPYSIVIKCPQWKTHLKPQLQFSIKSQPWQGWRRHGQGSVEMVFFTVVSYKLRFVWSVGWVGDTSWVSVRQSERDPNLGVRKLVRILALTSTSCKTEQWVSLFVF